ncbi:hypothetical protein HY745_05770 [Candidatus Desantisbacteria bacterium]|nr:hypothetical protein [Candidatus Desantisbacteria bacterium]
MRLIALQNAMPGMRLAQAVYDDKCHLLLASDIELTIRYINRLADLGISMIYVQDSRLDDVMPVEIIPSNLKNRALQTIYNNFSELQNEFNNATTRTVSNIHIINNRKSDLDSLINQILEEMVHKNDVTLGLNDVKTYDNYTFIHSLNVCLVSVGIAILMEYNQIHLFDQEFDIMKTHTNKGFEILKKDNTLKPISFCITLMHHERCDGSGYPKKLPARDIHEFSKIVALADVYDALTSDRPYRKRLMPAEALSIISKEANKYDTKILEIFKKHIMVYPIGSAVKLNTGEEAFIVGYRPGILSIPIVRVVYGEDKKNTKDIDLNNHTEISIAEVLSHNI